MISPGVRVAEALPKLKADDLELHRLDELAEDSGLLVCRLLLAQIVHQLLGDALGERPPGEFRRPCESRSGHSQGGAAPCRSACAGRSGIKGA